MRSRSKATLSLKEHKTAGTAAAEAAAASSAAAPRSFWEHTETKLSTLAVALFAVFVFVFLAHDAGAGSWWCPLSACPESAAFAASHNEPLRLQRLGMSAMCLFFDGYVIWFHATHPVHPKFIITAFRKRLMKLHVFSGALQCLLGPVAAALTHAAGENRRRGSPGPEETAATALLYFMSIWGFAVHVPTGLFLLRGGFGASRVLIPCFVYFIAAYAYTLGLLFTAAATGAAAIAFPHVLTWWLVLHVYVVNRLVFAVLTKFNILAERRYTISILLGVATTFPLGLGGTAGVPLCLAAVVVFNVVFVLVSSSSPGGDAASGGTRFSAGGLVNTSLVSKHFTQPEGLAFAPSLAALGATRHSSADLARVVFEKLDSDGSGRIELREVAALLVSWGVPSSVAADCMRERDANQDGTVTADEFHEHFEDVWAFAARLVLGNEAVEQAAAG